MSTTTLLKPGPAYMDFMEFVMLMKHQVFECAAHHGLTGMQALALCILNKPRPMNYFGKVFNCDPSNITGIVDGIEQKGLVERFEDPLDRRIKMVKLCPGGDKIRLALLRELFGPKSLILRKLSPTEVVSFTKLMNKITYGELAFI
ncbi:MAG TPA: MarR family transcriptional regulator [Candidatus Binatia bacterium]|nr:MarR family transcriptional regulator [Candidatus Binatia bacterium]